MSGNEADEDLSGRIYEYCIAQFAEKEGVGGGEFYTPSSIVKTLVAILKPFENCRVYDCCCGSGGMFVQSVKFIQAHSGKRGAISVYGQEANSDTWKMAKIWLSGGMRILVLITQIPLQVICILLPVDLLTVKNYISTENMQPNRGGVVNASSLPFVAKTQSYIVNDILISNIRPY